MSSNPEIEGSPVIVALWDKVLFLIATAVLCARPLISESFELTQVSFLPAITGWNDSGDHNLARRDSFNHGSRGVHPSARA